MTEKLNFEKAFKRLSEISSEMEDENLDLEKSMKLFEEGEKLNKFCQEFIDTCKVKIEKIKSEN